jgi:hypothetical protein
MRFLESKKWLRFLDNISLQLSELPVLVGGEYLVDPVAVPLPHGVVKGKPLGSDLPRVRRHFWSASRSPGLSPTETEIDVPFFSGRLSLIHRLRRVMLLIFES